MKAEAVKHLDRFFVEEGHLIDEALERAVRDAIRRHMKAGVPLAIYRNGQTVWVQPKDPDA
jgi:hypothetical protein